MASNANDGGIGGKFRRRPFRRAPATPYDHPQTAVRRANPNPNPNPISSNHGWISKIVDPASRIIARGASKFFSSVFQKRLTAPPAQPPPTDENLLSTRRAPEAGSNLQTQKPLNEALENSVNVGKNATNLYDTDGTKQEQVSGTDGLFELEQLLTQKTFTRDEFDHLTELLRSRTVEPSTLELAVDHENKEHAIVTEHLQHHELLIEPSTSKPVVNYKRKEKVIVSEHEDRMRSSSLPENIIETAGTFHDDATLPTESYAKKPSTPFLAFRPRFNSSRTGECSENGYTTPMPRGRSALYKMSRSPYFKVNQATNNRGGRLLGDGLASSSTSSLVPAQFLLSNGKQALKRGSSVLESNSGSFGPTRMIRHKSDVMSSDSKMHSPFRNLPSFPATTIDQEFNRRCRSSNQESNSCVTPVPAQSTAMARKIFQELGKLAGSPREKLSEKIEKKGSDNLDAASDSPLPNLKNSISPKQDRVKVDSPSENDGSAVKLISEAVDMKILFTSATDVSRKIVDANISDSAAISSQKEPPFQRTISEGHQELCANSYNVGNASGLLTTGRDKMFGKSRVYHSKNIPASNALLKGVAGVKASDRPAMEEGVAFTLPPASTLGSQTSPTHTVQPPLVDISVVTNKIASPACKSASKGLLTTTVICEPASLKVAASSTSTAGISESSGLDKEGKTLKAGELDKLFGNASDSSTSTSPSQSKGSLTSFSSFPAFAGPAAANFSNTGTPSNSCSPSTSIAAPPIFGLNPSFQFGSGTLTAAPLSVSLSRNTPDAGDSDKKYMKTLPVSGSNSIATCNAFSSTMMTTSVPSTSSVFSSIGDSTSSPATSSLFLDTASGSSLVAASTYVSSPMNDIFGFSTSGNPSTSSLSFAKNNFSNSGSHFGGTTGPIFGAQPSLFGSGSTSFVDSSAVQCGSFSSEPTFGLAASSSQSSDTSPFGAATPRGTSFSSHTGLSSSVVSFSSASIPSFAPTALNSLFSSNSQPSSSSMFASPLGSKPSSPSTGFSFGLPASTSSNLTSLVGSSSGPIFSFSSVGTSASSASPSPAQHVFSIPTQSDGFGSNSPGNDRMNVEDDMIDDNIHAAALSDPSFGQPVNSLSTPNFQFGTPAAPSVAPSVTGPQNASPFQTSGSFEFSAGGSFSLGSNGGDKSGRRIIRVKRDKHRKK